MPARRWRTWSVRYYPSRARPSALYRVTESAKTETVISAMWPRPSPQLTGRHISRLDDNSVQSNQSKKSFVLQNRIGNKAAGPSGNAILVLVMKKRAWVPFPSFQLKGAHTEDEDPFPMRLGDIEDYFCSADLAMAAPGDSIWSQQRYRQRS